MADAKALALDNVLARGRHIEQEVDDVIFEQIDFVDVQKTAVRARQQPRLEGLLAMRQRFFDIERTDDAVFRYAERQIDNRYRYLPCFATGLERTPATVAALTVRIGVVGATVADRDLRQ